MSNLFRSPLARQPEAGRFFVFDRLIGRRAFCFIYDRQARSEIIGRWETWESAQEYADELNKQAGEQR